MPYLKVVEYDTLTLPTNPDYWVKIKRRASYGDRRAANNAMLKVTTAEAQNGNAPDTEAVTSAEIGSFATALLLKMIVEWNVDDAAGRVLPITAASLAILDPDDGDFLENEAGKLANINKVAAPGTPLVTQQPSTSRPETAIQ